MQNQKVLFNFSQNPGRQKTGKIKEIYFFS